MKKIFISLIFILNAVFLFGQDASQEVEMADAMRSNGKIYIVVAVLCVIFAGITIYLINLDSKISKIEKKIK